MSDPDEIRALIHRWAEAVHVGDLDGVLADHSDDIVMFDVPPPHRGVRGLEAYRSTWPPFFEWQRTGAQFEIVELDVIAGTDVAFAYALLRCGTPAELEADPDARLRLTLGLERSGDRWRSTSTTRSPTPLAWTPDIREPVAHTGTAASRSGGARSRPRRTGSQRQVVRCSWRSRVHVRAHQSEDESCSTRGRGCRRAPTAPPASRHGRPTCGRGPHPCVGNRRAVRGAGRLSANPQWGRQARGQAGSCTAVPRGTRRRWGRAPCTP